MVGLKCVLFESHKLNVMEYPEKHWIMESNVNYVFIMSYLPNIVFRFGTVIICK